MRRRRFLKSGSQVLLAAPFVASPAHYLINRTEGSPIVSVVDKQATALYTAPGKVPNNDRVIVDMIKGFTADRVRVSNMMDTAVMHFTGQPTVGQAWESLFPKGYPKKETKISIKINLSYGEAEEENDWTKTICPFGPKVALSDAIVHGLTQMLEGHFPAENVTIFDTIYSKGSRGSYSLVQGYRPVIVDQDDLYIDRTPGTYGVHWVNSRNKLEIPENAPAFTAAPEYPKGYQAHQRVKRPVFENDFMINLAIAKDHREAGVTGVMKNNYGCTDNPMGTHGSTWRRLDSPYPGTRLCVPVFYKSLNEVTPCILNIMDAFVGVYHGGPLAGKVFHTNTLAVSNDPVAIDTYLLDMVNDFREKNGYAAIGIEDGKNADGHLNASFLRISRDRHQLGSPSQSRKVVHDLTNTSPQYHLPIFEKPQSRVSDVDQSGRVCKIHAFMDDSARTHSIRSWVEDLEGNIVKEIKTRPTTSKFAEIEWKPRLNRKELSARPRFVWHTEIDGVRHVRMVNF